MRKRLIRKFTKAKEGSLGYTLTELLVVIAIIAILCAIAIPSIIAISRALRFRQRNDYAKSIFMAAQQNLTEMRSDGGLAPLQGTPEEVNSVAIPKGHCGFPDSEWSDEYVYTASKLGISGNKRDTYALVLPVGSIDATLREQQVIIEYNPITGNVYSVFYSEEADQDILKLYQEDGTLPRDKDARENIMLGYYCGSGLSSSEIEPEKSAAEIEFTNGEEGIVTVKVPMPSVYFGKYNAFVEGLKVTLTITASEEASNKDPIEIVIKDDKTQNKDVDKCSLDVDGKTVLIEYVLDSLVDCGSFANLATGTNGADSTDDPEGTQRASSKKFLTTLKASDFEEKILPGENVDLLAEVEFTRSGSNPDVKIKNGILFDINPMFDYLVNSGTSDGRYTLAVANGRNLQNLNALHPSVADKVAAVVFTSDINWNDTVAYYNVNHGTAPQTVNETAGIDASGDDEGDTVVSVRNRKYQSVNEAPARALPYFVPIHNEKLFGTAYFEMDDGKNTGGNTWQQLINGLKEFVGNSVTSRAGVPVLTDVLDMSSGAGLTHATIHGNKHRVYNINIDTTKYATGKDYYAGNAKADIDRFTGLFGYVNTAINNLYVVNPIVKGYYFTEINGKPNNPATGALLGAGGYNTQIRNCGVYLENINWAKANLQDYSASGDQTWYGVSGEGAVGGLVGYSKSHRTVTGEYQQKNDKYLAFSNCFAAVNVSGNMRTNFNGYDFGYTNGIGGFIGNSQLTNFYNCYASGNVRGINATRVSILDNTITDTLDLYYSGRRSYGIGGFVGSSHGTRYTNCFATGSARNATADENAIINNTTNTTSNVSVGGFVGVMCYDETWAYGLETTSTKVAQHTVFENCYALGVGKNYGFKGVEGFSGTNSRLGLSYDNIKAYNSYDYYRLLAPHYIDYKNSTNKLPTYQTHYIFKDSYYLFQPEAYRQETGSVKNNVQSNHCASPISYSDLDNLMPRDGNALLNELKTQPVDEQIVRPVIGLVLENIWDFFGIMRDLFGSYVDGQGIQYNVYFKLAEKYISEDFAASMETAYINAYSKAFSDGWTPRAQRTHYYGDAAGRVYPFPMIEGMDYYGDWPTQSLSAGIAYYEEYKETNGNTFGYYLERQDNTSLKNESIYPIVSDGYAIMTASNVRPTVKINGKDIAVPQTCNHSGRLMDKDQQNQQVYYAWHLNMEHVKAAVCDADGTYGSDYYVPVSVWVGETEFYTLYMNPNVAIGHVNDQHPSLAEVPLPDSVKIRTARQFAALSTMDSFWGMDYVQQLNIDAATYYPADSIPALDPIGTAEAPFTGSYDGNGGYAEMAVLTGFAPAVNEEEGTAGYFGVLGGNVADADGNVSVKGSVSNLTVNQNGATVRDVANAGILAGVSNGEINNVTLNTTGEVTLAATESAGLLVGKTGGSIVNTLVSTTGTTVVSAIDTTEGSTTDTTEDSKPNGAGGVVGYAEGATILDSEAALTGGLSASAVNAGGFVGGAKDSTFQNIKVTGFDRQGLEQKHNLSFNADNAGGFAGMISGGQVTTVDVALTMDNSNSKTGGFMGGAVGKAENGTFTNISTVIPYLGNVIGDTAGGMFGSVTGATVRGSDVTVKHRITGKTKAGGFAGVVGEGDKVIENTFVKVIAGIIGSEGQAAGFAVDFGGQTNGVGVQLGEYGGYNADTGSSQPDEMGSIFGITEAAGFACTVTGQVNTGSVKGNGQICISDLNGVTTAAAGKAAGFAITLGDNGRIAGSYVTPAMDNTAEDYLGKSNDNLKVKGGDAAGFVMDVTTDMDEDNTGIDGSYALCKLEGTTAVYGFVGNNAGRINGSMANVTIPVGGYVFTGNNTGIVANCYGWFSEITDAGLPDTTVEIKKYPGHEGETGKYTSCYFIDMNLNEGLADGKATARLFDNKGVKSDVKASQVRDSLDQLNSSEVGATKEWRVGGTQVSCPYSSDMAGDYPYPELRSHYGDWLVPPQYSYGVAYYEAYDVTPEGSTKKELEYKIHAINLSIPAGGAAVEPITVTYPSETFIENEGKIAEAGYVLFCEENSTPFKNNIKGAENTKLPVAVINNGTIGKYKFYDFSDKVSGEIIVNGSRGLTAAVVPYYADAISVGRSIDAEPEAFTSYNIRTEEQLANMGKKPAAVFVQTHSIDVVSEDGFTTIEEFSGTMTANEGCTITTAKGDQWMTKVSGTVNVDMPAVNSVTAPIFGTVEATGSVTVQNVEIASISDGGALVDVNNGTVSTGKLTVNGDVAKLFGDVRGKTTTKDITVSGKATQLFGNVNGTAEGSGVETSAINVTGETTQLFGDVTNVKSGNITVGTLTGKVFGDISGTVNTGAIQTGVVNGQVFGEIGANTTVGGLKTGNVSGKIADAVNAELSLGNVDVGTVSAQAFGIVGEQGSVKATAIRTKAISGKLFDEVKGSVNVTNAITVAGDVAQLFGNVKDVTAKDITVSGNVVGKLFETVRGTVSTGNIQTGTVAQGFGNVAGSVTTGTINTKAIGGQLFGAVSGTTAPAVKTGAITVDGTAKQLFGDVTTVETGTITTGSMNENGTVDGSVEKLFGDVETRVKTGAITVNGNATNLFGVVKETDLEGITVNGNVTTGFAKVTGTADTGAIIVTGNVGTLFGETTNAITNGITVNGNVTGQMFGTVSSSASVGAVRVTGTTKQLFGNVKSVTANGITLDGAVTGNVFGDISATVKTNGITIGGALSGKIAAFVTGGSFTPGVIKVTPSEGNVPVLFGKISGANALVTGSTIDVGGAANIPGGLFAEIAGGTVKDFAVSTTGTLGNSLIGSVTGNATVSGFQVTTGVMKGALVGSALEGKLSNVKLDIAGVTGDPAGLMVGSVKSGSIENCTVEANTVTSSAATFGILTGTNAGTLSGNIVKVGTNNAENVFVAGAVNVSGTTVGGLVGKNNGEISGANSVIAAINYIGKGGVTIGGIVGEMTAGSLTTTKTDAMASGSIVPENAVSGTNNIGGAIGEITGGIVGNADTTVTTAMTVDDKWGTVVDNTDKTFGSSGITNYGPVGMFVGKAGKVTLTNCTSTAANTKYQFLGHATMADPPAKVENATTTWNTNVLTNQPLTAYSDEIKDGVYTATYTDTDGAKTALMKQDVKAVDRVATELVNCKFQLNGATKSQTYGADTYFYTASSTAQNGYGIGTPVTMSLNSRSEGNLTYKLRYDEDDSFEMKDVGLYYKNDDNSFGRVLIGIQKVEDGNSGWPFYSTRYKYVVTLRHYTDANGGYKDIVEESETLKAIDPRTTNVAVGDERLYTLTVPSITAGSYFISDGSVVVGEKGKSELIANASSFDKRDSISNYVYTYENSKVTDVTGKITHSIIYNNANEAYYGNANPKLLHTFEGIALGDVNSFQLYPVTTVENAYQKLTFTYQNDANDYQRQFVTYTPMENGASVVSLEEEVPVTEATEATEATAVTTETTTPAGETGGETPGTEG